jgi:hypothetical protein
MGAPQVSTDLRHIVARTLSGFGSWPDAQAPSMGRIEIEWADLPVPALVQFTLVDVLNLDDWGRAEKTAFQIPFCYRGVRCMVAHQKFGLRLYVASEDEETARNLRAEIVGKLSRAIRIVERRLLRDYGETQVARGAITIVNQLHSLRGMYQHFREEAEATFVQRNEADDDPPQGLDAFLEQVNRGLALDRSGAYTALAAINAYFSYLEHALVLVLPFTDFDPARESITEFIGMRWRDKFRRVFDLNGDTTAKRMHDRLYDIAETYRNTYGHGGFDKAGGAIYFHVPTLGALPVRLTDVRESPHFDLVPIRPFDFHDICSVFDQVDELLRTNNVSRFGMRYAEAGLDVRYDEHARKRFVEAMESDQQFEELLDQHSYAQDMVANMDW